MTDLQLDRVFIFRDPASSASSPLRPQRRDSRSCSPRGRKKKAEFSTCGRKHHRGLGTNVGRRRNSNHQLPAILSVRRSCPRFGFCLTLSSPTTKRPLFSLSGAGSLVALKLLSCLRPALLAPMSRPLVPGVEPLPPQRQRLRRYRPRYYSLPCCARLRKSATYFFRPDAPLWSKSTGSFHSPYPACVRWFRTTPNALRKT